MKIRTMEKRIASVLVDDILAAGYRIGVSLDRGYDVDEMLMASTDKTEIMKSIFSGDDCHVFVQPSNGEPVINGAVNSIGWFYLVLGNDGWDLITDYTANLEKLAERANKLANELSEKAWA